MLHVQRTVEATTQVLYVSRRHPLGATAIHQSTLPHVVALRSSVVVVNHPVVVRCADDDRGGGAVPWRPARATRMFKRPVDLLAPRRRVAGTQAGVPGERLAESGDTVAPASQSAVMQLKGPEAGAVVAHPCGRVQPAF